MGEFDVIKVVRDKTPKTKIIRNYPVKSLPQKKFDGQYCEREVSRYAFETLFKPWYSDTSFINVDLLDGEPTILYAFKKEGITAKIEGEILNKYNQKWKLRSRAEWGTDNFHKWRNSIIPTNIEKATSIILEAIIQPSEIEKFNVKGDDRGYSFNSSDILEDKYGVSIGWNDHDTRHALEATAESVYFKKRIKDTLNSNVRFFDFEYVLKSHILNPTPERVHEAVKSYIPVHDYFVKKFPVFMEAAQLIDQASQLQDFLSSSKEDDWQFKKKYYKLCLKNKEYFEKVISQFFEEADKRLKDLKFPEAGLEKYLKI